ncbi:hypothetical protein GCM10027168_28210 [Streptomyces capparidis]
MTNPAPKVTLPVVRQWLAERLAERLRVEPGDIGHAVPLQQYALDSLAAFTLRGAIEDEFGITLDLAATRYYPTLEALAEHLTEQINGHPTPPPAQRSAPRATSRPKDRRTAPHGQG